MSALTGLKVLELGTLIAHSRRASSANSAPTSSRWKPARPGRLGRRRPHTQLAPFAPGQLAVVVGAGAQQALHRAQPQDPRARDIARQLALEADVVAENYRLGVLEKWGLGYEQLRALNPATIMVRLSGYGQTGPMKDQPGFGAIGESMGGLRYVSGHRTGRPCGSASPSAIRSPRCMA